jgi:hypothetical protein
MSGALKSESRVLRGIRSEEITDYTCSAKAGEDAATEMQNSLYGSVVGKMQG